MDTNRNRPWTTLYPTWVDADKPPLAETIPKAWAIRVGREPDSVAIRYFDGLLTVSELDTTTDALAAVLQDRGVGLGEVVGIYLQNIPQYVIAPLALWKIGATALVLNPMYKGAELRHLFEDSGAKGILCLDSDYERVQKDLAGTGHQWTMTTTDRALQTENDPRVFGPDRPLHLGGEDLLALAAKNAGRHPTEVVVETDTPAVLTYTSGTTGPSKGAVGTHANAMHVATGYGAWQNIGPGDEILAVAPLFHITGTVATAVTALVHSSALVFINRPAPAVLLDAIKRNHITLVIGSITVFNALLELPQATPEHFSSLRYIYSGGAPIPPTTVTHFKERFGHYIHNVYGMTETCSAVIAVPPGHESPVDPNHGTLSIGIPLPHMMARVIDHSGAELPVGAAGELELDGPQITPCYLNKPEETAHALPGGRLRTGDVAIIDEQGWIYLVDRMKDQINTSGFKVWPREVEDTLYEHPSVLEAAVVGQPDAYKGEAVVAYISLKSSMEASAEELIAHCRERLAAYKYPREIHILPDLPKTHTGKIQRRELRIAPTNTNAAAGSPAPAKTGKAKHDY